MIFPCDRNFLVTGIFYHDALPHIEFRSIWLADFFNTAKDLGKKLLNVIFSAIVYYVSVNMFLGRKFISFCGRGSRAG